VDKSKRKSQRISRREFARAGILTVAAAVPSSFAPTAASQAPSQEPALSADSQAEVDTKMAAVLGRYGNLLSNAEKLDVRRLLTEGQKQLTRMRLIKLGNKDQPANILKLFPDVPSVRPTTAKPRNTNKG
jgi:hypothetical protein